MDELIGNVKSFCIRTAAVFTAIFSGVTFIKEFGLIDLQKLGVKGLLILIVLSIVIVLGSLPFKLRDTKKYKSIEAVELIKKINNRMGTLRSSQMDDADVIDKVHRFISVYRQDLLDYSIGDYHSIRILKGKNISKEGSTSLVYTESTDSKTEFSDIEIKALDMKTGEELKVESISFEQGKVYTHKFKILFSEPVLPNEEFEICYYIKIPDELTQLSQQEEMMSISLKRATRGVDNLEFNVCLDFKPKAVHLFKFYNAQKGAELLKIKPKIEEYFPITEIEKKFDIKWGNSKPYIIRMNCPKPDNNTYIIQYKK